MTAPVEIIVPTMRESVKGLLLSLAAQTVRPALVTVVTTEVHGESSSGVRWLSFESDEYCYGREDVVLRLNTGIWASTQPFVIFQNDDQIAPPTMVEDALLALENQKYVWGNHRLLDFAGRDPLELSRSDRQQAMSRENPVPPAMHGFYSCYGGMFAASTDFLQDRGGFDMAYLGRHGSEDQQLGYRLMRERGEDRVLICEPPFAFHPIELKGGPRAPYEPGPTNACDDHDLVDDVISGAHFRRCTRCPYRFSDQPQELIRDHVLIPFVPGAVRTKSHWL